MDSSSPSSDASASARQERKGENKIPDDSFPVRPAVWEDIPAILALLEEFVQQQLVLPRTREEMEGNYRNFMVACHPGTGALVGAGALRPHGDGLYEVRSLAVTTSFHGQGIGSQVVKALLRRARETTPPAKCVFTLTKRPEFFRNLGFRLAPKEDFPAKIWTDCRLCPKYHCCDETALRREP